MPYGPKITTPKGTSPKVINAGGKVASAGASKPMSMRPKRTGLTKKPKFTYA